MGAPVHGLPEVSLRTRLDGLGSSEGRCRQESARFLPAQSLTPRRATLSRQRGQPTRDGSPPQHLPKEIILFRRIANIFRGFLGLFISGLERQNPEALLEVEKENLRRQTEMVVARAALSSERAFGSRASDMGPEPRSGAGYTGAERTRRAGEAGPERAWHRAGRRDYRLLNALIESG